MNRIHNSTIREAKRPADYNYIKYILIAFCLIPYMGISGIRNLVGPDLYQLWQVSSTACLLFVGLRKAPTVLVKPHITLFFLYQLVILSVSSIRNGFSYGIFSVCLAFFLIFLLLQSDLWLLILRTLVIVSIIAAIINLISIPFHQDEQQPIYFIGGKNAFAVFLIPAVFFVLIYSAAKNNKVTKAATILVFLFLLSIALGGSTTGIVTSLVTLIFLLIFTNRKTIKAPFLITIILLYSLFLIFSESFLTSSLWTSFTDLFGKDSTLTSRSAIWSEAIEMIKERPLLGHGRGSRIIYRNSMGVYFSATEAHNFILEVLFDGGLVAFVLMLALLFYIVNRLDLSDQKHRISFLSLIIVMTNGLTESTVNNILVVILLGLAGRFASSSSVRSIFYGHSTKKT